MKVSTIYRCGVGGIVLLLLSSCCPNSYGSQKNIKNSTAINHESATLREEDRASFRLRRLFPRDDQVHKGFSEVQASFKKYEDQLTDQDKRDISFVVSSGAEKSSISLAMSQGEIKSALNRIRGLHPLSLIKMLAENPSLIEGMRKMQGRDWIWNMFLDEMKEVFSLAASQGVITEENIAAFASSLHLDTGTVSSIVHGERWPELLDIVITRPA